MSDESEVLWLEDISVNTTLVDVRLNEYVNLMIDGRFEDIEHPIVQKATPVPTSSEMFDQIRIKESTVNTLLQSAMRLKWFDFEIEQLSSIINTYLLDF